MIVFLLSCTSIQPGFFVTSVGNPNGGDFGGLEGADARCASLAEAAGLRDRGWRAYLSTTEGPVHARDRIGSGPWYNVAGQMVAADVDDLHLQLSSFDMLNEYGAEAARGAPPGPEHDILTGSTVDGFAPGPGRTCQDWTSSSPDDLAIVGHHDWETFVDSAWVENWNQVHAAPCDRPGMERQRGSGRIYCFASDP